MDSTPPPTPLTHIETTKSWEKTRFLCMKIFFVKGKKPSCQNYIILPFKFILYLFSYSGNSFLFLHILCNTCIYKQALKEKKVYYQLSNYVSLQLPNQNAALLKSSWPKTQHTSFSTLLLMGCFLPFISNKGGGN